MGANIEMWERTFNEKGIGTFAIDGFTGRGIRSTSQDQSQLGRLNLILDAYRALDLLSHDSRVDPDKIMLMGFSRGGQATLYAAMTRLNRLWNTSGVRFRAYLPFYPDCMTRYRDDTDVDSAGWRRRRAGRLAHRHSNQVRGGVSRGHPACIARLHRRP